MKSIAAAAPDLRTRNNPGRTTRSVRSNSIAGPVVTVGRVLKVRNRTVLRKQHHPVRPVRTPEISPLMEGAVRIDKWLWAVRLFKTRSLATDACAGGKVKVNGQSVKPARAVRPGDVIKASTGEMQRTVRVTALLEQRVGAKLVKDYLEDLTPESEYRKARERGRELSGHRPKGLGRPTKKQRRTLESYFNEPPLG